MFVQLGFGPVWSTPPLLVSCSTHLEIDVHAHATVPLNYLTCISILQWPVAEFALSLREDFELGLLVSVATVDFRNSWRKTKCMLNCEMDIGLWKPGTKMLFKECSKGPCVNV